MNSKDMNSREALQHIVNVISNDTHYMDLLEEEIKVIARDLELLEEINKIVEDKIKEMIGKEEWGQYE